MDELSEEARELLEEARRAYAPDPGAADRVLARVMAATHAPGLADGSAAPAGVGSWSAPLKMTVASAVIAVAALSVYVGRSWQPEAPRVPPDAAPSAAPAVPAPALPADEAAPPSRAAEAPAENAPETSPAALVAPSPAAAATPSPPPRRRGTRAEPAPADPAADLRLLRQAQSALSAGRGGEALALLRDHQRAYPRTQFGQERDAIRILALCATGRESAARRLGRRFLERAGHSPMAGAVRESCAGP
jgi:hypothetical protein